MTRKRPSLTTRLASALLALGDIPYTDAKEMSEDQMISLYQFDHGILHETEHPDRDKFWNLTPTLIRAHREKTKRDQKIIAKSRRIRKRLAENPVVLMAEAISSGWEQGCKSAFERIVKEERKRKIPRRVNPWPPKGSRRLRSRRTREHEYRTNPKERRSPS